MHHDAWTEVYRFWKDKRSRIGKPLLRKFWPVTPSNDTDPHKVRCGMCRFDSRVLSGLGGFFLSSQNSDRVARACASLGGFFLG